MNCSLFNIGGCIPPQITDSLNFLQTYWMWIVGVGAALLMLFVLAQIKAVAGWPGVVTVLLTVLTFGAYAKGRTDQRQADRKSEPPLVEMKPPTEEQTRPHRKSLLGRSIKDLFR